MDILESFANACEDVQQAIIIAMASHDYSYWSYNPENKMLYITNLNDLRLATDCEEQCVCICAAVATGLPKKMVVETSYTTNFSNLGERFGSLEGETIDPFIKNWIRSKLPIDFVVEFVFNPYVPQDLGVTDDDEWVVMALSEDLDRLADS